MSDPAPKAARRSALGRGLGSLITGTPTTTSAGQEAIGRRILEVPVEQVAPRTDQPRQHFEESALVDLATSIREKGILSPILVRRVRDGYAIIAGERRWRAAQRAGLKDVPVVIEEADDDEAFELALIENIQRQDLNAIEEAEAYQRLMKQRGCTQEQLATTLGKDRSTVSNALRLLRLPEVARTAVVQGRLSMGHARALLGLEPQEVEKATRAVLVKGLSVRQTESLVRKAKQQDPKKPEQAPAKESPGVRDLVQKLQQALGARVRLQDRGNKGTLSIEYSDLDELDRILERILGER